jgi:site-specific DNA-methyltransferase (adenine-specific)
MDLLNTIAHMDIFDLCDCLDDNSVDMILSDLPYGITDCEWDNVIPFEPMWECFKRIIKPRGAIVLTASQPFTSQLVMSNLEWFRYEWVWEKSQSVGFLNAYRRPCNKHESILLFADGQTIYNPQLRDKPTENIRPKSKSGLSDNYGNYKQIIARKIPINKSLPQSIIKFNNEQGTQHPTQKPVALFEYLIRTYTQPGEVVFDPCVGSGTTALAARNTGRNYIVGDNSAEYVEIARKRLAAPYTLSMFDDQPKQDDSKAEQLTLFDEH